MDTCCCPAVVAALHYRSREPKPSHAAFHAVTNCEKYKRQIASKKWLIIYRELFYLCRTAHTE